MAEDFHYRILATHALDARTERTNVAITVTGGVIASIDPIDADVRPLDGDLDLRGNLLVPGFIDIHIHGGAGEYVMDGTYSGLQAIARHLGEHGVTSFLSTTVTGSWEQQAQAVSVARQAMTDNKWEGAAVLGVHLEGPYINPKRKGAQPAEHVRTPDVADLVLHLGDNLSIVRIVTLAPEMPGGLDLISFLKRSGIVPSIGHTDATYDQVSAGIDAGAQHVTHCFNAMRQLESREPGVVGAALTRSELTAELIWDNIHVHAASCRALISAKGPDGVILISDGIPGAGMSDGFKFNLGAHPVTVQDGAARLTDGTLAGSLLTLDTAFMNAARYELMDRAKMTSFNAARSLGLDNRKGLLQAGYDADITVLDAGSKVVRTIRAGRTIFDAATQ